MTCGYTPIHEEKITEARSSVQEKMLNKNNVTHESNSMSHSKVSKVDYLEVSNNMDF